MSTRTPTRTASRLGKLTAAGLALFGHGAVALAVLGPPPVVQTEGQSGAVEARLGSAFADMSTGTLTAAVPDALPKPPARSPVTPTVTTPLTPTVTPPVSTQVAALTPVVPTALPATPPQTEAQAPDPSLRSVKPVPRPARDTPQKTATKAQPKPAATPAPRGNSTTTAQAGQSTGKATATATSSGSGGAQKSAGNAAASNYPGLVMRKLSRVSRPRVSSKGAALVAFGVTANGGLSGVSIARSSGSAELDRAALTVVQRAAPFPAPPTGAQRSFSVEIKGR